MVTSRNEQKNRQTINLYGRTEDNESVTVEVYGFDDYFFAGAAEVARNEEALYRHDNVKDVDVNGFESLTGQELGRVVLRDYYNKREVASMFEETYETDVFVTNRARIDLGIYTGVEVPSLECHHSDVTPIDMVADSRVLSFDIETDDRGAFPELGEKRIISLVAHDSFNRVYHGFIDTDARDINELFPDGKPAGIDVLHYYPDEKSMLEGFVDWMRDYSFDVITGWNVEDFDAPYLLTRMQDLDLDISNTSREGYAKVTNRGNARMKGHSIHDLLLAYKMTRRNELRSYSLDSVAEAELGEAKLDHTGESIWDMFREDCPKLMEYNAKDVRLVTEIDDEAGVLDFKQALRHEVGVDLEGTTANNQYIEMMARRKLHEKGVVGPDATYEQKDELYEGAFVFDPYTGVAENVVGVDLSSLYPMTMAMLNASPETKVASAREAGDVPTAVAPNGARFRLDEPGVFKELVDDAIALKSEYKTLRDQHAAGTDEYDYYSEKYDVSKTITNSVYGVAGWERFFLYDEDVAEAVTTMGRVVIQATQEYINESTEGEVIYGDTDSNYLRLPSDWNKEECLEYARQVAEDLNENVYPELAEEYGMPASECLWNIEVEAYMERFFQAGQKKFYAYRCTWKDGNDCPPKDVIKGFGSQRSDSALLSKELQEKVLKKILDGADDEEIGSLVYEAASEVGAEVPDWERVGIPGGLGKELDQYAWTGGTPQGAHPRAAFNANQLMGTNFGGGSKPMRAYLEETVPPVDGWDHGAIDVIAYEQSGQVPDWARLDIPRMTETLVLKPLDRILQAVDIDVDAAAKNQLQSGLGRFM